MEWLGGEDLFFPSNYYLLESLSCLVLFLISPLYSSSGVLLVFFMLFEHF